MVIFTITFQSINPFSLSSPKIFMFKNETACYSHVFIFYRERIMEEISKQKGQYGLSLRGCQGKAWQEIRQVDNAQVMTVVENELGS